MKSVSKIFIFIGLIYAIQPVLYASEATFTLPDGTTKTVESRKIYSSPNPADNLLDAIAAADLAKLKDFLAKGISVNSAGSSGEIPLMEALGDDKAEILDFLLTQGADVNMIANVGGMETTALEVAINNGHVASVKKLLDHGAKTEKEDTMHETVLFSAVRYGNPEIVKLLISHGADRNHKNILGETPASLAEKSGKSDIAKIFK